MKKNYKLIIQIFGIITITKMKLFMKMRRNSKILKFMNYKIPKFIQVLNK